jgi:glutathione synthase
MKLLFIVDPLDEFKIYKDSTYAMMLESERRGHQICACLQGDLVLDAGMVVAASRRLRLAPQAIVDRHWPGPWYDAEPEFIAPLAEFDAVIMRKDPPFDMEYVYSTYFLELAQRKGARVFNDPRAIRDHNEKLAIAQFDRFIAPTLVTRNAAKLREFVELHGQAVLKPLDGMGGSGVFRAQASDSNLSVIIETLNRFGRQTVMAQRYIPEINDGDKRILLIAGKPVPYALARIPKAGEARGNLAAGGTGVARPLTERDQQIALALGPQLAARGLLLVGLDVIGDYLTEINVTSPTCFQEISEQSGFDVAAMFVDAVEQAVRNAPRPAAVR